MNEILLQVLLEGGTLAVFVIFVIYQARTGREERNEIINTMLELVNSRDDHADEQMRLGIESIDAVNGSLVELTKANAELSKVIAVHDSKMDERYDEVIRSLDRISSVGE